MAKQGLRLQLRLRRAGQYLLTFLWSRVVSTDLGVLKSDRSSKKGADCMHRSFRAVAGALAEMVAPLRGGL